MFPDHQVAASLRGALAQRLAEDGSIRSPQWRAAVADVPRHVFVPAFFRQVRGEWERVSADDPGYLTAVYGDHPLTTQLTAGRPTSSSSQPSLMVEMLEALDVRDGDRVGEVATGTGYNAGLLCHRVGDRNVVTVEVDPGLVRLARERLARVGYQPEVIAGDARTGLGATAGLDRLIVTCGFDAFPHALASTVRPGGVVVCPIGWGNARMVLGHDGSLEGRFLPGGAFFMKARGSSAPGAVPYPGEPVSTQRGTTDVDLAETRQDGFRFVQALALPGLGEADETEGGSLVGYRVWRRDGSWAHVLGGEVRQGGPVRLWDALVGLYRWYVMYDRPSRERFGITVTPHGQRCWLDFPLNTLPDIKGWQPVRR
ncbi:protein-L-isoaspartate(D-aspartate) O-methyltransferase [Streptomyces sp. JJ66]|uniref:methyltransferase domain-containing protein n=1 Tax=Streptomyces sp. JJ66 TaxID=2803843 RepID=UPI001C5980E0|nr:methyltransferase domain-containing protein [Streptomyces sp. JJ66]MBW1604527.1 protein-L-isoaspartate(D-aspartate) O-methyltransferase [Streptomyces sp. JJ66]